MNIVFATAEVSPFAKTGGLGDVCGALPKALARLGHDLTVFTPLHRAAATWCAEHRIKLEPLLEPFLIPWSGWAAEARLLRATLPESNIPVIFVANDHYFDREGIYAARPDGFNDYIHRFTFFCRAVIRGCELLDIRPDILHAHDWHTALLPIYLHSGLRRAPHFERAASVFTIHNLNYQGDSWPGAFPLLGLHPSYWSGAGVEHFGSLNLIKGGIIFADQVTTVSPGYAREIQSPEFGAGLDGVVRDCSWKLTGILNGIDAHAWDPATDPLISAHFSPGKMLGKKICKRMLGREAGIKLRPKSPLLGVVSRLVGQKGFDLLLPVADKLIAAGAQLLVLGSGEAWLEKGFLALAAKYPTECHMWAKFDNALAHRIFAGADILLVPSRYEPCGLNQMYALRYGTMPVVRLTGGLADTIDSFDGTNPDHATGFGFRVMTPQELYTATWIAMLNYHDTRLWKTLQARGMAIDFSWERSAAEYETVYRRARG